MKLLFKSTMQRLNVKALSHPRSLSNLLDHVRQTLFSSLASARWAMLGLPLCIFGLGLFALVFSPAAPALAQGATLSPRQVVEYALTLEKLEADFYRRAVAATQGGALAGAPTVAKMALVAYGQDEAQHVTDLSAVLSTLGGNPNAVTIPANPNYRAILGRDPFANPTDLLLAGQYVEDLGVAAYKGQVQNLLAAGAAGKPVLAAALAIHTVEARHAAGIRFLRQALLNADVRPWIRNASEVIYNEDRGGSPIPFNNVAFDGFATRDEVLALVGPILTPAQATPRAPEQSLSRPRRLLRENRDK